MFDFSVVIGGQTFTQADFEGLAYLQGVPDSLSALADSHVGANVAGSTTTFLPGSDGTPLALSVDTLGSFKLGDVVLVSAAAAYQFGRVLATDHGTSTLTISKLLGGGGSTSSWVVHRARGPVGDSYWTNTVRPMDEGGFGASRAGNGLLGQLELGHGVNIDGNTFEGGTVTCPLNSSVPLGGGWLGSAYGAPSGGSGRPLSSAQLGHNKGQRGGFSLHLPFGGAAEWSATPRGSVYSYGDSSFHPFKFGLLTYSFSSTVSVEAFTGGGSGLSTFSGLKSGTSLASIGLVKEISLAGVVTSSVVVTDQRGVVLASQIVPNNHTLFLLTVSPGSGEISVRTGTTYGDVALSLYCPIPESAKTSDSWLMGIVFSLYSGVTKSPSLVEFYNRIDNLRFTQSIWR